MNRSGKAGRVIFCMVVLISITTMLIMIFKMTLLQKRAVLLDSFLRNNYPEVVQAEIEPDYLMASYLKDTLVGRGLDIKFLWLSLFLIIILCAVNLLIYVKRLRLF